MLKLGSLINRKILPFLLRKTECDYAILNFQINPGVERQEREHKRNHGHQKVIMALLIKNKMLPIVKLSRTRPYLRGGNVMICIFIIVDVIIE